MKEKELSRLIHVAQLYYEQNKTQSEIANELAISRPAVSYLLNKARKAGIVKIDVLSYYRTIRGLGNELCDRFNLKSCHVVSLPEDLYQTGAEVLLEFLPKAKLLGLGWGYNTNKVISALPQQKRGGISVGIICPLIGAITAPQQGYHPDELVKELADKTGYHGEYLNCPAISATAEEQLEVMESDDFKQVEDYWRRLTTAFITLGSYPSVPDHGSAMRFGKKLIDEKAVGCLLSYFFNPQGKQIRSDEDYSIQIPLDLLARVRDVIGFVPQEANVFSVISGLKTGYIKHLVITEALASDVIKQMDEQKNV
ncbi:sugar-binding transcriptional regulator [Acetobacterium wieringae]|uniref:Sorbitol operon regulator n=1 Tax=Acetobacterium wieringae TaxID=52694 RepID=A0A1F2PEF6_9FIRM|nr:sugar-binding domain-containing protein [Acetobacterium wieringae]OFV69643.1 sorbitol operon regulator [Acetobacterium wieringae]